MTDNPLKFANDPLRKTYLEAGLWSSSVCLDNLFARNVRNAPEKIILCDTADKQALTGMPGHDLRAAQAEAVVNAISARFAELGLRSGDVAGIQMPNTVELPLILLACLQAGIIPALLPLLWVERDLLAALDLLKPKALISVSKTGTLSPADTLRYAAATMFSVHHVMAFGAEVPDGVINLQNVFEAEPQPRKESGTVAGRADKPALITFRMTAHGPVSVIRSHNHAMAAALMPLLESGMDPDGEVILSSLQTASLAGLAGGFLPWLLCGGRLVMHQIGDPQALPEQIIKEKVTRLAIPAIALPDIAARLAGKQHSLKSVISICSNASARPPALPQKTSFALIDGYALDEMAFITRARDGLRPRPLRLGAQIAPSNGIGPALAELGLAPTARLIVRGASVPYNPETKEGFQQTGYLAALEGQDLRITGRIDQLAHIGGMAVPLNEVASVILQIEGVAAVQVNAIADDVYGEILEARVHFSRGLEEPLQQRLDNLRRQIDASTLALYKIPARIVVDPTIVSQPSTVHRTEKKRAV